MSSPKLTAVGVHAPGGAFTLGVESAGFTVLAALGGRSAFGTDTHRLNFPGVPWHGPEWPMVELAESMPDLIYSNPAPGENHEAACFVAGTQVLTTKGPKAIEQVRVGDLVMTYRRDRFQMVRKTIRHTHTGSLIEVGTSMGVHFVCTPEHPVCVGYVGGNAPSTWKAAQECAGKRGWFPATMQISDTLTATVRSPQGGVTVYNLEVEEDQSYIAGGLLVHNCTLAVSTALTLRPRAFIIEGGAEWFEPRSVAAEWLQHWTDSGYQASLVRLNAAHFGLPQLRRRVFFVAAEATLDLNELTAEGYPSAQTVEEAIGDLTEQPLHPDPQDCVEYVSPAQNEYQVWCRQQQPGVTWQVASPGAPSLVRVLPHLQPGDHAGKLTDAILAKTYWKDREKTVVRGGKGRPSMYYRRLHPAKLCPALPGDIRFVHPGFDRFITPRESARLMGFPDHFIFGGISSPRANLEAGRTLPPRLGELVARHVLDCLVRGGRKHVARVDLSQRAPQRSAVAA